MERAQAKHWDICHDLSPNAGGLFRSVMNFREALCANVLSVRADNPDTLSNSIYTCPPKHIFKLRSPQWCWWKNYEEAKSITRSAKSLLVHGLYRSHVSLARRLASHHQCRLILVPHGCLDAHAQKKRRIIKELWLATQGRSAVSAASRIVFSTTRERHEASRYIDTSRSVVIHWPVPIPSLTSKHSFRLLIRREHRIPENARILLAVTRLHTFKRIADLIKAFLKAQIPNAYLFVAGLPGNISHVSLQKAFELHDAPTVRLLSPIHDQKLGHLFMAADGYVSASTRENFSYSLGDAFAHGLPVLISTGHYLISDIRPAHSSEFLFGWVSREPVAEGLSVCLNEWAAAPDKALAKMGALARDWAAKNLSQAGFKDKLLNIVEG